MIRILAVLCALLVVVVAAEATSYRPGANDPVGGRPGAAEQVPAWAAKDTAVTAGAVDQWLAAALARPLFAPNRKPVAGSAAVDSGIPRLTGIIVSPDGASAIFQMAGDNKSRVARHGERIGTWELTALTPEAVSLRKDNEVIVLRPGFARIAHDATAIQESKPPRSRWEVAAPTGMLRARWSNPQLQP
jgi:general secretion pathway protein N